MNKYVNTETYKKAMENINEELEKQKDMQTKFITPSKQYIESLKEEIRLLEKQKKLTDDYINKININ
jgi:hypothetical protein